MKKIFAFIFTVVLASVCLSVFVGSITSAQISNLRTDLQQKRTLDAPATHQNTATTTDNKGSRWPNIPWETIAVVISILSGTAAIMGFSLTGHKKKRAISKYMEEIDATYMGYKSKAKRCEAELYRLHDLLEERLKGGKIDESLYELLCKRIDKYLAEVKEG